MRSWFTNALLAITASFAAVVPAIAEPAPPDRPMLWRVEGKGLEKPSYLFGTIHLATDRVEKLHPAAEQAFTAADVVHTEISLELADQMAAAMFMMRRDGKKLSDSIGPELTAELKKQLEAIQPGLDIATLQPMKTWAAAMLVVLLPHQLEGRKPLDLILWNRAKEMKKTTGALEDIKGQIGAFDILNEEEQVIYLRETLALLKDHAGLIDGLVAAYEKGDDAALQKLLAESMELESDDEKVKDINHRLMDALLAKRDIAMADKIHEVLTAEPGKAHFFAVGAAHYLGENSIRKHLADKGYTITRITE
jgi:uncharacterized protein YbaP (TraB family)